MLKPVPVPDTPDRESWERLRAYWLSVEMEESELRSNGRTPNEAAETVDARLKQAFSALFPEAKFPLALGRRTASKAKDLPGGIRTEDGRFWWIVSRPAEGNQVTLPFDVTADELATMAEVYDPAFRRASVVRPRGGPSHVTGLFDGAPPGSVDALQFDGHFLWALVGETFPGALEFTAEAGAEDRSIGWWEELPELAGDPPYLHHIALLTGEQPAIPNMPANTEFFASPELIERERVAVGDRPMKLKLLSTPTGRLTTMKDPKDTTTPEPGLADKLLASVKSVLGLASASEPPTPKIESEQPNGAPVKLDAAGVLAVFEAGLKPLATLVSKVESELEALRTQSATAAKEARRQKVTAALDRLVAAGRLSPPLRKIQEPALLSEVLTEEQVDSTLAELEKLPRLALVGPPTVQLAEDQEPVEVPTWMQSPTGAQPDPRLAAVALAAHQKAAAEGKTPEERYRIYRAELFRAHGEHDPAVSPFELN